VSGTLPHGLVAFLREIADRFDEKVVRDMRHAFTALDDEALGNRDAANLLLVLCRIVVQPRPLLDRVTAVSDVLNQRGRVVVTVKRDDVEIHGRQN
jgi:hypothetical protein